MWLTARLPPWGLAYLNPPIPLFKGAIRACGLSIAARLPCLPAPARHLMTCLNPPILVVLLGLCPKP